MVSTAAFHVRGSVPGLGGLKEAKMFLLHPRVKLSIVGSLRDQEVACSASDRQGSNFESCVWRTVSSHSSRHPQEVFLAQFSLYVHKGGLKPDSFHLHLYCSNIGLHYPLASTGSPDMTHFPDRHIFDVGQALIQQMLTVMYYVYWAHNRLRLKHEAITSTGLIWGQCHRLCADIITISRWEITNLWSLYPALMSRPRLFVYSHMEEVNVLCNISVPANTTH